MKRISANEISSEFSAYEVSVMKSANELYTRVARSIDQESSECVIPLLVKILYSDARATVGHVSDSGPTIEVSCSASDEVSRIEKRSKLIG